MTDGVCTVVDEPNPVSGPGHEPRRRSLAALPRDLRSPLERQPARDHGRQPDRSLRQPELRLHRRAQQAQGPAARHARRARATRSRIPPATGWRTRPRRSSSRRSTSSRASATTAPRSSARPRRAVPRRALRDLQSRASTTSRRPTAACGSSPCIPGVTRRRGRREHRLRARRSTATFRRPGLPTAEELQLIREKIDPKGFLGQGSAEPRITRPGDARRRKPAALPMGAPQLAQSAQDTRHRAARLSTTRSSRRAWAGSRRRRWLRLPATRAPSASSPPRRFRPPEVEAEI